MKKFTKFQKTLYLIVMISLVIGVYGFVPLSNAASLTQAKDTLSDSDLSVSATHTVTFDTGVALIATDYIDVVLPAPFGDILVGGITCPGSFTASAPNTETARCTATGGIATGTKTITIAGVTNPAAAGSQLITITSYSAGAVQIETATVAVAIIDNVNVSATVSSTLTFEIRPLTSGTDVNGYPTTISSATTSLAFGTLTVGTSSIMGQELRVTTNADYGYSVTVEQDQNLTSASLSDIDSFIDGTSTAPAAWQAPSNSLDQEWTYGHMGYTSDDSTLLAGDTFGTNLWQGFNGVTPVEVMYHNGPADGTTQDRGMAKVSYRIQIGSLQESGDYYNVLTYIATPTY